MTAAAALPTAGMAAALGAMGAVDAFLAKLGVTSDKAAAFQAAMLVPVL